jgi:hypothetical protein
MIHFLGTLFNRISYMHPELVRFNIEQGCSGGMSEMERSIDTGVAGYFMDHFAVAYLGLISNASFREIVKHAVYLEIALDERGLDCAAAIRKRLRNTDDKYSGDHYRVNFETYNEDSWSVFTSRILGSFEKTRKYDNALDELARELTVTQMKDIGYIVSNFMYLFRAVSRNEKFVRYLTTVIDSVENSLEI